MEQRDLIKDQIEQLGRVIAKIVSDFMGMKSEGKANQGLEITNERLRGELDIDMHQLISLEKPELTKYLSHRKLTEAHLELLSKYLTEVGTKKAKGNNQEAAIYWKKAIELLDISDEISKTVSFDRRTQKQHIESLLERYC